MIYRAVGNRCAVDLEGMDLPISDGEEIRSILFSKGFKEVPINVVELAEALVGKAKWKLPSRQWEAPHYFDCASLAKWLYAQRGIGIPRRCVQQFEFCRINGGSLYREELLRPGDLLFVTSPFVHGKRTDEHDGIGHVGLMVGDGNVICATNSEFGRGVVKIPFHQICATRKICGAGRVIPQGAHLLTLLTPSHCEVETSDDVRWIILRALGKG